MHAPEADKRSPQRRDQDDRIAAETPLAIPDLPNNAVPSSLESHLTQRHPQAVFGIVENGLVRPIDPAVALPEHARVIIVASAGT